MTPGENKAPEMTQSAVLRQWAGDGAGPADEGGDLVPLAPATHHAADLPIHIIIEPREVLVGLHVPGELSQLHTGLTARGAMDGGARGASRRAMPRGQQRAGHVPRLLLSVDHRVLLDGRTEDAAGS